MRLRLKKKDSTVLELCGSSKTVFCASVFVRNKQEFGSVVLGKLNKNGF